MSTDPPTASPAPSLPAPAPPPFSAFVSFPSPLLTALITRSLLRTFPHLPILSALPSLPPLPLLQWADYDRIDHSLTLHRPSAVLSSSYVIRKALIRKHFLASAIEQHVAKHPESRLVRAAPRTWAVELRWADEMEEMWVDELWDLARDMEERASEGEGGWWILKPGMADKGQGIRVFGSREELEGIMAEFEDDDSEDEGQEDEDEADEAAGEGEGTRVSTQQMRHFVIQEYIHPPLLISPHPGPFIPHKFHIRAYTLSLSSSPLSLYLHPRLLCLFASSPYSPPTPSMSRASLGRHLTNTCLIEASSGETEDWVFELDELVGKAYDSPGGVRVLTREDVEEVRRDVGEVLAETWRAAIGAGQVHFQPLPNAFELFGADLLLSLSPASPHAPKFRTHILELNASPDIDQTGSRLASVIEELVDGIVEVGVEGWANGMGWSGEQKGRGGGGGGEGMRKVLEVGVRG